MAGARHIYLTDAAEDDLLLLMQKTGLSMAAVVQQALAEKVKRSRL